MGSAGCGGAGGLGEILFMHQTQVEGYAKVEPNSTSEPGDGKFALLPNKTFRVSNPGLGW